MPPFALMYAAWAFKDFAPRLPKNAPAPVSDRSTWNTTGLAEATVVVDAPEFDPVDAEVELPPHAASTTADNAPNTNFRTRFPG